MRENRRIKFKSSKQREFILNLANKYGSLKNLGLKLCISYSTIKKYAQEVLLLPENIFNKIIKLSKINK